MTVTELRQKVDKTGITSKRLALVRELALERTNLTGLETAVIRKVYDNTDHETKDYRVEIRMCPGVTIKHRIPGKVVEQELQNRGIQNEFIKSLKEE